ncbi:MAG TPA: NUDIX hydrolase [Steroidobacteraceae bacterium]|jgi:8-oxo-dGTP pyrophosphatase MutT (NUDIX family)|nr:NUDIX hydrolase [Steroidobacteraceae bacterium]
MPESPEVTVAAVTENGGRFLVVEERVRRTLVLNQPAGHVERGETLLAAVVREVREETAWQFTPDGVLGAYLWRNPATGRSILRFAFTGVVAGHDAHQRLDRGIVGTHWLLPSELEQSRTRMRSPLVLRCVHDYIAGRRLDLEPVAHLDLHSAPSVAAITV